MKTILSVVTIFFLSFALNAQDSIISLLPDPFLMPGMQTSGEAEVYEGDYLFDLINGGADVYLEYGFVRVVTQAYSGMKNNSTIKVEIYEMKDNDGAFGIFSLTAPKKQVTQTKGYFSVTGSGYRMIHKGRYFIMLSHANLSENPEKTLLARITEDISEKIKTYANYPALVSATEPPCPQQQRSLYFKGDIALRNVTYLNFKIPFTYSEGIFYKCNVFDFVVFKPTAEKGMIELTRLLTTSILNSNETYHSVKESFGFSIKENDKLRYEVKSSGDMIFLVKYI